MFTDPALAPLGPTVDKPRVGTPSSPTPIPIPTTPHVREEAQREERPLPPAEQMEYNYNYDVRAAGVPAMERPWTYGGQYPAMQSSWAGWGQAGSRERYYALNRNAGGHVRASFNAVMPSSCIGASHLIRIHMSFAVWCYGRVKQLSVGTDGLRWLRAANGPGARGGPQWEQRLWARCWARGETTAAVRAARQDITDLAYRTRLRAMSRG